MDFKKPKKPVCALGRPGLGLLVLSIVIVIVVTAVVTYFVTKDAFDDDNPLPVGTTTVGTDPSSTTTTTTTPPPTEEPLPEGLRLNKTLFPSHYNVELQPFIYEGDDFSFAGKVELWFTCNETTDPIVLHIDALSIEDDSIQLKDGDTQTTLAWTHWEEDKSRHFFKLFPVSPLEAGKTYSLSMRFNGTLIHDDLSGFYRSSYEENGETKYLATTQFQRTHARRAFPCFDEPSFKATFNITLVRRGDPYSTISNMPIIRVENRTEPGGVEWYADVYDKTVIMSPYLLAFVVSDFIVETYTTPAGTKFNLWARAPYIDSVQYALNISGAIMEAFEDYTNISFVLPETDQIAIPDFAAGAMENWGLITYRETALLYNPDFSTTADKQYVARVIAHELAHMWFGNLVTCDWWDDTWLNEGFATYFEYHNGVDVVHPGWKVSEYFLITEWGIMVTDGSAQSQPVYVKDIEHHSELGRAFSSITYRKGGSVIRMMQYFLGEETFRKGLENYLKAHEYSTVVRSDLYEALQEQAITDGRVTWDSNIRNLSDIMDTWIIQQNYPLVRVTVNRADQTLTVEQSHFVYDTNVTLSEESPFGEYIWDIFFAFMLENVTDQQDSWIHREKNVTINYNGTGWMLANLFHQGFFRTWYDDDTYDQILAQLKNNHTVFPVENRGQIIDDAFNLARAGIVDEVRALKTLEYMTDERDYLPWFITLNARLPYIKRMLYSTNAYGELQAFLTNMIEPTYTEVGWDNSDPDEHLEKYLRQIVIGEACELRYSHCLQEATNLYSQVMAATDFLENIVSPDLRNVVYCSAIRSGGSDEWNHALDRYKYNYTVYIAYEKRTLLNALSCTREQWIQNMYLEMALEINTTEAFTNIAAKEGSQTVVWQFLEQRWNDIPYGVNIYDVLNTLTDWMSTEYHLEELKAFFDRIEVNEKFSISSKDQEALIAKVERNVEWVSENLQNITSWLQSVNSNSI